MVRWDTATSYDLFMGRWSRIVAREFVRRLERPAGLRWLDVGCGSGSSIEAILELGRPSSVSGVDLSSSFIEFARARLEADLDLRVGPGDDLPFDDGEFDVTVSGLVLNFMPDPIAALREWRRVTTPSGAVAVYVWDYAGRMEFLRAFWDAAIAADPKVRDIDEGVRFPICRPQRLEEAFEQAGFDTIDGGHVEIITRFAGFDDFWEPFLAGQGPAGTYVAALEPDERDQLASRLRAALPTTSEGSIELQARAWTVLASTR